MCKYDLFLSYAKEDFETAESLRVALTKLKYKVWMDKPDLIGGQRWRIQISDIIKSKCRHFVRLISKCSLDKIGFGQKEMILANEVQETYPPHKTFIIPVRIENISVSDSRLVDIQYIDFIERTDEEIFDLEKALGQPQATTSQLNGLSRTSNFSVVSTTVIQKENSRVLIHDIAESSDGSIFVCGDFDRTKFVKNKGGLFRDAFLYKLAANSLKVDWKAPLFGDSEHTALCMRCDDEDSVIVAHAFHSGIRVANTEFQTAARYATVISKFDVAGKHQWSNVIQSDTYVVPESLEITDNGKSIVTGRFRGLIEVDGLRIKSDSNQTNIFVVMFDRMGRREWLTNFAGPYEQQTRDIAVMQDGSVVLGGLFKGEISLGNVLLKTESVQTYEGFLARISIDGQTLWAKRITDPSLRQICCVSASSEGSIFLAGIHGDSSARMLVGSLTADGVWNWMRDFGENATPTNITTNGNGHLLVVGYFKGTLSFGKSKHFSEHHYSPFLGMMDTNGNILHSQQIVATDSAHLLKGKLTGNGETIFSCSYTDEISLGSKKMKAEDQTNQSNNVEKGLIARLAFTK